jgi:hypothetical protein
MPDNRTDKAVEHGSGEVRAGYGNPRRDSD